MDRLKLTPPLCACLPASGRALAGGAGAGGLGGGQALNIGYGGGEDNLKVEL